MAEELVEKLDGATAELILSLQLAACSLQLAACSLQLPLALPPRPRLIGPCGLLDIVDNQTGNVLAGGGFDAFEAGG